MDFLNKYWLVCVIFTVASCTAPQTPKPDEIPGDNRSMSDNVSGLAPYSSNPYYWSYDGEPVILLGGSDDDNLFQFSNLEEHLNLMQNIGANYVRNTMSSREESDLQPFKKLPNGSYDLNQWNEGYWDRFEDFLKQTAERKIFVQIELWDQWDHNQSRWNVSPWNPENNSNYSASETQLKGKGSYENVINGSSQRHDLFLTVPELQNDVAVLKFQKKFIDKILSYSLKYDHVLYTVTNELFNQHSIKWSRYWIDYVQNEADISSKKIFVTEMIQNEDITTSDHRIALDNPKEFEFVDFSQNSVQRDQVHWDKLQWGHDYIKDNPRPINHTKTYGGDEVRWTGGDEQGIERFWRNIIGGAASVRFHRPNAGLGLNTKAQVQIKSARMLVSKFNIFEATPDANSKMLMNRSSNEAYLSYIPGEQYAVYLPNGGQVELDLREVDGQFKIEWLKINANSWSKPKSVDGGKRVPLETTAGNSWVALITAQ